MQRRSSPLAHYQSPIDKLILPCPVAAWRRAFGARDPCRGPPTPEQGAERVGCDYCGYEATESTPKLISARDRRRELRGAQGGAWHLFPQGTSLRLRVGPVLIM